MPFLTTAATFFATISSVSPNISRRSEWPTNDVSDIQLGQKQRAYFTRVSTGVVEMTVLRAEGNRDAVGLENRLDRTDVGKWRMQADVSRPVVLGLQSPDTTFALSGWPRSG